MKVILHLDAPPKTSTILQQPDLVLHQLED